MKENPIASGKSSFDIVDVNAVFSELGLEEGSVMVDIASGVGNYSFAAAAVVGDAGTVYAVDAWEQGIDQLKRLADERGVTNIRAAVADVSRFIPLDDNKVDACLIATALHDLVEDSVAAGALRETARVLRPGGRLTVVEFNKIEGPPGPPRDIRLSPQELDDLVLPYGFEKIDSIAVGEHTYATTFRRRSD